MKLRIVSGSLRGRTIHCPDKKLSFRPTLERTRQALADMMQPHIPGSRCADLCAGSGSFGFELLSRGAASVDFVENDPRCAAMIRESAERFGVSDRCRIVCQDVARFAVLPREGYGILFFDPPYEAAGMPELVPLLRKILLPAGILLYQRRKEKKPAPIAEEMPFEIKTFGDTVVELYRH